MNYQYNIVEIFESLQGEGFNTGMPSVFIRFGRCNLACDWCDTPYNQFQSMTFDEIIRKVRSFNAKNIIISGGEPTIVANLVPLLARLKQLGYFLAIETNGLKDIPREIDYIATSPKRLYQHKYQQRCIQYADEVRIVNDCTDPQEMIAFCQLIASKIKAKYYYLSPCEQQGEFNLHATLCLLGRLNQREANLSDAVATFPHWQLSLQTHKLIGIA